MSETDLGDLSARLETLEQQLANVTMERDMWQRAAQSTSRPLRGGSMNSEGGGGLGPLGEEPEADSAVPTGKMRATDAGFIAGGFIDKREGGAPPVYTTGRTSASSSFSSSSSSSGAGDGDGGGSGGSGAAASSSSSSSSSSTRLQQRHSSFSVGSGRSSSLRLRATNSVAKMDSSSTPPPGGGLGDGGGDAAKLATRAKAKKKARFDIVKCTDEVCELVHPKNGLITTSHQDTTTAKLIWKDRPKNILCVKKPGDTPSRKLLCRIGDFLVNDMNCNPVLVDDLVMEELSKTNPESVPFLRAYTAEESKALHKHVDIVITIGGDGTVLWTAQLFDNKPVPPTLSFSMGSLGFLTPFAASSYKKVLQSVLEKGCFLSLRSRVVGDIVRMVRSEGSARGGSGGEKEEVEKVVATHSCLNEIVIDRGPSSILGNLMSYLNGQELTRVQADGLIIGSPTGSTAYSLSASGSIVHPAVPCMVFTPICPHTLSFRPMIFPDSVTLRVAVPMDSRSTAWAAFDGKHRTELCRGDSIKMRVSRFPVPLICKMSEGTDFLASVKEGLFWNMRVAQKKPEELED